MTFLNTLVYNLFFNPWLILAALVGTALAFWSGDNHNKPKRG